MPRLSITLTGKALEIYKGIKSYERSKWVSEAIEEKDQREKGIVFTPEQIEYLNKYYIRKESEKE